MEARNKHWLTSLTALLSSFRLAKISFHLLSVCNIHLLPTWNRRSELVNAIVKANEQFLSIDEKSRFIFRKNLGVIFVYRFAHIWGTTNSFKDPTFVLMRDYCNISPESVSQPFGQEYLHSVEKQLDVGSLSADYNSHIVSNSWQQTSLVAIFETYDLAPQFPSQSIFLGQLLLT